MVIYKPSLYTVNTMSTLSQGEEGEKGGGVGETVCSANNKVEHLTVAQIQMCNTYRYIRCVNAIKNLKR